MLLFLLCTVRINKVKFLNEKYAVIHGSCIHTNINSIRVATSSTSITSTASITVPSSSTSSSSTSSATAISPPILVGESCIVAINNKDDCIILRNLILQQQQEQQEQEQHALLPVVKKQQQQNQWRHYQQEPDNNEPMVEDNNNSSNGGNIRTITIEEDISKSNNNNYIIEKDGTKNDDTTTIANNNNSIIKYDDNPTNSLQPLQDDNKTTVTKTKESRKTKKEKKKKEHRKNDTTNWIVCCVTRSIDNSNIATNIVKDNNDNSNKNNNNNELQENDIVIQFGTKDTSYYMNRNRHGQIVFDQITVLRIYRSYDRNNNNQSTIDDPTSRMSSSIDIDKETDYYYDNITTPMLTTCSSVQDQQLVVRVPSSLEQQYQKHEGIDNQLLQQSTNETNYKSQQQQQQQQVELPLLVGVSSSLQQQSLSLSNIQFYDKVYRHELFAQWIVQQYGYDIITKGSGILDVAGGNGQLLYSLLMIQQPVITKLTLLDPHPRLSNTVLDLINTINNTNNNNTNDDNISILPYELNGDGSDLLFDGNGRRSSIAEDSTNSSSSNGNTTSSKNNQKQLTEIEREKIRNCSLIVGMHPDQATESIILLARRLNVPFAILPCCVMPKLFPHRKQSNNNNHPVRSYKSFCQYLIDMGIQHQGKPYATHHLPFWGRNTIIFSNS